MRPAVFWMMLMATAGATLAARAVAAEATSISGTVAFAPVGDESSLPEPFRLAPHSFRFEQAPQPTLSKVMRVSKVTFPSPVVTPHPNNNTVHCEYFCPIAEGKKPGVVVLHILGGDFDLARMICRALAARGTATLFLKMPYYGERRQEGSPARMVSLDVEETARRALGRFISERTRRRHDDELRSVLDGRAEQAPQRDGENGDDGWLDAIEEIGDGGDVLPAEVGPGQREHQDKGRADERKAGDERARGARAPVANVDRHLGGVGSRDHVCGGESVDELLSRDPSPLLDDLIVHHGDVCGRAAEADRAEAEEEARYVRDAGPRFGGLRLAGRAHVVAHAGAPSRYSWRGRTW